jgi:hypothetical protein
VGGGLRRPGRCGRHCLPGYQPIFSNYGDGAIPAPDAQHTVGPFEQVTDNIGEHCVISA